MNSLAILCERQFTAAPKKADNAFIRACVMASRFSKAARGIDDEIHKLRSRLRNDQAFREDIFWAELTFVDEVAPTQDVWHRLHYAENDSIIGQLTEADRLWLAEALADESRTARRPLSLYALLNLWEQRGRVAGELDALRAALKGDTTLEGILAERTAPPIRNAEIKKMDRERERRRRAEAGREAQRLKNWINWRKTLLADPASAFNSDNVQCTVMNLYKWLDGQNRSRSRYNVWNKGLVVQAFGDEVAKRAAGALQNLWRATPPVLWSARKPEERNSMPNIWIYGLCGLSAEASEPGWETHLTSDEARIAAAYATTELNGFASFVSDLVASHPVEVETVLGDELSEQLRVGGDHDHLMILQNLVHADRALQLLLTPRLLKALPAWPTAFTVEIAPRWANHLDNILRILGETCREAERQIVAEECVRRYEADPASPLALSWLRGSFRFDPECGTRTLTAALAAQDDAATRARAIETFASLFGDRNAIMLQISDPSTRARTLADLLRSAYTFIRHEDDNVREEGVYASDARDHAETARNFLLSTLLNTPGPEARRVILELVREPEFAHFKDRLRLLARRRAASDAEFPAFKTEEIADLERHCEAPPHNRDGLFRLMMDRLDDLAHDFSHYDFTDRRTLRTISNETEMQRTLAWRIHAKANGAFVVTREDEVADLKRTDIRVSAVRGDQKGVIEVKIADERWSLTDLERALTNQLLGQYLRHETCKAGCLLLTYDGKKKFWIHPATRKHLKFPDMVAYLNERARSLESESLHSFRLAVFGLDLTDPALAPVHRGSVQA